MYHNVPFPALKIEKVSIINYKIIPRLADLNLSVIQNVTLINIYLPFCAVNISSIYMLYWKHFRKVRIN